MSTIDIFMGFWLFKWDELSAYKKYDHQNIEEVLND